MTGFRVKLQALSHYHRGLLLAELPHLPDPDQVLSHSLWHDVRQEEPAPAEPRAPLSDVEFGPDRAIADIAAEFCRAYRLHGEADRAMLAGSITEDQWKPHHDAITELAEKLAASTPKTAVGMALKCLGPIGMLAWYIAKDDDPSRLPPHKRIAAEFEAAILNGALAPIQPEPLKGAPASDRAWAIAQAAEVDLSSLTILHLHNLFDRFAAAADHWCALSSMPWASRDRRTNGFHDPNAAGLIIDREEARAAEIRTRIVEEICLRKPSNELERNWRLETLIQWELLCEGSLEHAPELRAEIAEAWGG